MGFEQIIALLLFGLAAAFHAWLKNRKSEPDDSDWVDIPPSSGRPTPPPMPSQRPKPASDWETELRRLLEGQEPVARPKPPPPPMPVPPVASRPTPARGTATPSATTRPAASPWIIHQYETDEEGPETTPLAKFKESSDAYERAARLHDRVSERLSEASAEHQHYYKGACSRCGGRIEFPAAQAGSTVNCPHCGRETKLAVVEADMHLAARRPASHKRSAEAEAVVGLLRHPQTARQAVIASVILGQPKGFDV